MYEKNRISKLLALALIFQGVFAMLSEAVFFSPLEVKGDIKATMANIASDTWRINANIMGQLLTALGIAFLGVMFYITLKKTSKSLALTALTFYVIEAAILAYSRVESFELLRISREYLAQGQPEYLLTMGKMALEKVQYAYIIHMLPFCLGAVLFYSLLFKSKIMPRAISIWGVVSVIGCLIGTSLLIFGQEAPIAWYALYIPFEYFIAVWILVKGFRVEERGEGHIVY